MSNPGKLIDEIVFDHKADAVKVREFMGTVHYIQNGVKFSSGFKAVEILERIKPKNKDIDDMTKDELREALRISKTELAAAPSRPTKRDAPKTARERADAKLADYKPSEKPDFVQQALAENKAAQSAEEHSI